MDREKLKQRYDELKVNFDRLVKEAERCIREFFEKEGIHIQHIDKRVKEFDSFVNKIERKGYENPFEDTEDLCGIRIICHLPSELDPILDVIRKEFEVLDSSDKANGLEPDRFGYLSHHLICKIKDEWCSGPPYRDLQGLQFEIQIRTVLQHAWANMSHKLHYKSETDVPSELKRHLYQLSAIIENLDTQFDTLWSNKQKYVEDVVTQAARKEAFDATMQLNSDSHQALLAYLFPTEVQDYASQTYMYNEIVQMGISIAEILAIMLKEQTNYNEIKDDVMAVWAASSDDIGIWSQAHALRLMLLIYDDRYYARYINSVADWIKITIDKWRANR